MGVPKTRLSCVALGSKCRFSPEDKCFGFGCGWGGGVRQITPPPPPPAAAPADKGRACRVFTCRGGGPPDHAPPPPAAAPADKGRACRVFTCRGGGGSIEPPKTGGGGFGKRAQLTSTINQSL